MIAGNDKIQSLVFLEASDATMDPPAEAFLRVSLLMFFSSKSATDRHVVTMQESTEAPQAGVEISVNWSFRASQMASFLVPGCSAGGFDGILSEIWTH